jgi:hypothetical protein
MDAFTENFLANVTATLTNQIIDYLQTRLPEKIKGAPKAQAIQRCVRDGITTILAQAATSVEMKTDLLTTIFTKFFNQADTGREIAKLLRRGDWDLAELVDLFAASGYDPVTLPGLKIEAALEAFKNAFLDAASDESELQTTLQTGQARQQTAILHTIEQKLPTPPPPKDFRRRYLERLAQQCLTLPLAALGGEESTEEEVNLEQVYTDLDTTTPLEKKGKSKRRQPEIDSDRVEYLSALAAFEQTPRLVLLGDPGAGKSTFVKKIIAWQARAELTQTDPPPTYCPC